MVTLTVSSFVDRLSDMQRSPSSVSYKLDSYTMPEGGTRSSPNASSALFVYDSLLCLAREIDLVWRRSFRFMTLFYFITRHLMLVSLIVDAVYSSENNRVMANATLLLIFTY
jgi:hypothetical protein